jgi:hypothetical protein
MLLHDVDIVKTKAASSTATRRSESAEEEAAVTVTTNHKTDDVSDISNVLSGASSTRTSSTSTTASSSTAMAASALDLPNNHPSTTTRKAVDKMNFESGLAGEFTLAILQHLVKKESVCENLHQRYEEGGSLREKIQEARRLTGGGLFSKFDTLLWMEKSLH